MKNAKEMRTEMVKVFKGLKGRSIDIRESSELNKTANTIIKGLGQQLRYSENRRETPHITFLNCS
jgi:hypothetical protein